MGLDRKLGDPGPRERMAGHGEAEEDIDFGMTMLDAFRIYISEVTLRCSAKEDGGHRLQHFRRPPA